MGQAKSERGPAVLAKSLRVLETVSISQGLALSEIARKAGLPISTAHRIVQSLTDWGALEREQNGLYYVGLRIWEVASTAPRAHNLRDRLRPFVEDLHYATKQNIQLAILEDDEALVVEHLTCNGPATAARIGGRLPLHASGVGQVLLAWGPHDVRERVITQDLESFTPFTFADGPAMRRVLHKVRTQGYALVDRTMPLPAVSIASPVLDAAGQCVAAIAVVLPTGTEPAPYVSGVMLAARSASRSLSVGRPWNEVASSGSMSGPGGQQHSRKALK
ncbi:IclR family transcriptional regulator [Cellulosimicrobium funkei]|nr:IclR family transcriptional regulator [Cellulosimicrobium funkei]